MLGHARVVSYPLNAIMERAAMPNLNGAKWGSQGVGTPGGVVTWSIVASGQDISWFESEPDGSQLSVDPESVYTFDLEAELRAAFAEWSIYGNIEFLQVRDPGGAAGDISTPDIRIFFAPIPGNTLGFAFFPPFLEYAIAGDILLDVDSSLNFDVPLFRGLAVHEIGHALGLEHIETVNAIMNPILTQPDILADDIQGIRQIYGAQDSAPVVYTLPADLESVTILHNPEVLTVNGNALGNLIIGTGADETINGLGGDDTLEGGAGNDQLNGGAGTDWANLDGVTRAAATVSMIAGGLRVVSALGTDELIQMEWVTFADEVVGISALIEEINGPLGQYLTGGGLADRLNGTDDSDTLMGLGGDDILAGGLGNDSLDGGSGNDSISASDGNDVVVGGFGHDQIGGGPGDDVIDGGDGNDVIGAGLGVDLVSGGNGNDVVAGGAGDDTLDGGAGDDSMSGSFGNDLMFGADGTDDLGGGAGRDTIDAGAGNDRVGGGEGDDSIQGGDGHDFLAGGGRDDILDGGAGNDTINGGVGNDLMTGGSGADQFVFSAFNPGDADVITDFEDGIDRLFIRILDPDTGAINLTNGGTGLAGFVDALGIVNTAAGAQLTVNGHQILLENFAATDLTVADFIFL
ncbi:hypothetical protein ROS217_08600 [Roseovarius sp. 217]|nr:hypothetical protein ROS217_08600 [Roseovarius sp. 217]